MSFRLYRTSAASFVQTADGFHKLSPSFQIDALFASDHPVSLLADFVAKAERISGLDANVPLLAPMGSQEIWAAGVTYLRSRTARMEESKVAGGDSFYDKVYHAVRPELFFKATPHRVAAPGTPVRIRGDSRWNVPEPEVTLALTSHGRIFGYTVGNDMSSRDIEGENPLYLPQAKVYDRSAAIGPCLLVTEDELPKETRIEIDIRRGAASVFSGHTTISQIKRSFTELAEFLFRDNTFPVGCFLMTGTGIVPGDSFTLNSGDEIRITIAPIGTLMNPVG
ncbi:MAG TPA: fumarylacetoacetate hydrolase family protein [Opitutaceae bacterium]|nr:fumarylacetoacetate hydrolase family protein [Opitutaceae bacterium]